MHSLARFTFVGILATLSVSCSGKITDPKKMVEIAAKHDNPHSELKRLYAASVLPDSNDDNDRAAWNMAQDFTKKALLYNRAGIQADTAEFPWSFEVDITQEPAAIQISTGKPFRSYFITGYFHAKNIYGAKVRLDLTIRLRTNDHKRWQIFQLLVSDPSRPILSSYIVEHEMDLWDGFKILTIPDSLRTELDAYIKKPSRESGVLKKKEYGLEIEGPYTSGKKHGHFVERNSDGIVFEGEYVNGKRHGRWVRRYKDGKLIEAGDYLDGEKHGRWDDPLDSVGNYVHGQRQGRWIYKNSKGTVIEGEYVDNKKHGRWTWRTPAGETAGGEYVNGKKQGRWVELLFSGVILKGPYVDGKKQGRWTIRDTDGTIEEGPYVDDKRHGRWIWRRPDGTVDRAEYVRGSITIR